MTILHTIETAVVAGVLFGAIDFVWLTAVAKKFYYKNLGALLREKADLGAAIAFYVLYIIGMCYFVLAPAVDAASFTLALRNGALYGLFTYGTYDLTNLATLRGWPRRVVLVDMVWGVVVSGIGASISYLIVRHF